MLYIPCDPLIEYRPLQLVPGTISFPHFQLSINGETCPVRLSRESRMPFNRVWPGYQRSYSQTEQGEFAVLYGDEPITVTVSYPEDPSVLESAILRPVRNNIPLHQEDGVLRFTLPQNGYFSLECGSIHTSLQILYCKPLADDGGAGATLRFDKGVHFAGKMKVHSGDKIYIHPEAVVYGSFLGNDVENVTIYGGGILDDSTEERVYELCYTPESSGCIRFFRSKHLFIQDIICMNASNWVLSTFDCSEVHIDGVKILGQWRYNTDGIDLVNAQHCSIRRCFVRSFDDTIVIKALYCCPLVEDIVVEDCVLWCGWGKTLEIGLETSADEFRDLHFRNCDLIHNSMGALTVDNGNYSLIHDVTFENISVEISTNEDAHCLQKSEDMPYPFGEKAAPDPVIILANRKMVNAIPTIHIAGDRTQYGCNREISFKDLYIYCEGDTGKPKFSFASEDPDVVYSDNHIERVYIHGKLQDNLDSIELHVKNSEVPTYRV